MPAPGNILVVCTANICRSPMAAALLKHALAGQPEPLRSLEVVSAGVSARGGEPATEHAIATLKKVGLDLTGHRSRPLNDGMLDQALAVICMTESHRAVIRFTAARPPGNLWLFREFMPQKANKEIADPYGSAASVYQACRDEMVEAIPSLLKAIKAAVK